MDNTRPTCPTEENKDVTTVAEAENTAAAEENGQDMAQAMADFEAYEESFKTMSPGDFLTGRVVSVNDEGILVDVGYKTEGLVPANQVTHRRDVSPTSVVKVGDEINVVVQRVDESEGTLILSKKRADSDAAWRKILHYQETGETFSATCTEQVKGGLIVDVGLRGFVPASHVDIRPVHDLSDYVGDVLNLKVLEVDKARRKVVLSRKKAEEELRQQKKEETMSHLTEGQIVPGTVARLTNFGAFVNLGGVDGLVHISELSWKRIKHPNDVVQPNQAVDVLVLKVDPKKERISLSLRQARPDPWLSIGDQFNVGDIITGKVTKFAKNYTFLEVQDGVEGVIPVTELASHHVSHPNEILKVDQEVSVRIIELRPEARRMVLSVKQAAPQSNEGNSGRNNRHADNNAGNSIGDIMRAKLGNAGFMQMLDNKGEEAATEE